MQHPRYAKRVIFISVMLSSLVSFSAYANPSGSEGWIGNNGYIQWHPQTGELGRSGTGTQCYFCGDVNDSDGDGVPDQQDQCPNTPKGIAVDTNGCPLDADGDGVPDHLDQCPETPKGMRVDAKGCPLDSDGDGVPDHLDQCPDTPRGTAVDARGCPMSVDSDGDGVPDQLDQCPNTPRGVKVDAKGCPLDSDGDGVTEEMDQCPNTPLGAKVNATGCWVLDNLHFATNKANITPVAYPILDEVVRVLNNNPKILIEIHGHTDNTGSVAFNNKLAYQRAKSVLNYLVKHGVPAKQLTAAGFGLHNPLAPNTKKEGRALNRRVELKSKQ